MTEIRPMRRDDLESAAALTAAVFGTGPRVDLTGHLAFLSAITLDHPWADPEIPSLVAVEAGTVIGFIASHVRHMRLDGHPIRAACCSHLVVDPRRRMGAPGALLLGQYLAGPQELTYSGEANPLVARMWETFGGQVDHLRSCSWMQVFQPGRWALKVVRRGLGHGVVDKRLIPVTAIPLRSISTLVPRKVLARWVGWSRPEPDRSVCRKPLVPEDMAEQLPDVVPSLRLAPAYDPRYVSWLFAFLDDQSYGATVVRQLVRRGDRTLGWYVYMLERGGVSQVLQLVASRRHAATVLTDLLDHARDHDSTLITGRVEPHLAEALRGQASVLGFGDRFVLHSRRADVRGAITSGRTLLTRLDGGF